jgi:hypothetical protein
MQAIETVTVDSGGAASITFSSIPDTFTDLKVVLSLRYSGTGTFLPSFIKFNSNTSNYSRRQLFGTTSGVVSFSGSDQEAGNVSTGGTTANAFSSSSVMIPNYLSSSFKSYSADVVTEQNATLATQEILAGLWSDTSAITSLAIVATSGRDFVEHSTATLYGILAGSDGTTTVT